MECRESSAPPTTAPASTTSTASGIFLWSSGKVTPVGSGADADSYPPTTGNARVSADGRHLVFVSSAFEPTGYDNRNIKTGVLEPEVYLFTAPGPGTIPARLVCASCNPSGERPVGGASLPGASPNGSAFDAYKPRVLSADSQHLFFDSFDEMAPQDTNHEQDVYQWEASGTGGCTKYAGCVNLISSGRAEGGASFADATTDGSDAYFLTDGSLVPADPGLVDVYVARVAGGLPVAPGPIPCFGDACQALPPEPEDPTPGSLRSRTSGNLPLPAPKKPLHCKKNQIKKFGKCVKKKSPQAGEGCAMRALRLNRLSLAVASLAIAALWLARPPPPRRTSASFRGTPASRSPRPPKAGPNPPPWPARIPTR